jgi:hypothetical protein
MAFAVVDSSGSVNYYDWEQQASFTKNLVAGLKLGANGVQYSLSVFGDSAKTLVPMTADVSRINALPFNDGNRASWGVGWSTYMDTGFQNVGGILDQTTRKVPKIVVMITDGVASDTSRARAQANVLKSKGYTVMSILVGSGTSISDVAAYVTVPAIQVASFGALSSARAAIDLHISKTACDQNEATVTSIPNRRSRTTIHPPQAAPARGHMHARFSP